MFKKILLSTLAAVMAIPYSASALVAPDAGFWDVTFQHENYLSIGYLRDTGVVEGYKDGSYKPEKTINRAEFLKIALEGSGADTDGAAENCYSDVKGDEWFAAYVCYATEAGFVKGYDDGMFHPEREINFAEAAKMIAEVYALELGTETDVWYEKYVTALEDQKAIPDDIPAFDYEINRGEMAEMIWRILEKPAAVKTATYAGIQESMTLGASAYELTTFESCPALREYMEANAYPAYELGGAYEEADAVAAPKASSAAGDDDYSSTNVQVAGVDEADIIKNDGKYIYIVGGETVKIVEAVPAGEMKELDEVSFDDEWFTASEIYLDGDQLVVIGNSYKNIYYDEPGRSVESSLPVDKYYYNYSEVTKVYVFDISDREDVKLDRWLSFEGWYSDSRKVDGELYLVMSKTNYVPYEIEKWAEESDTVLPLYIDSAAGQTVKPLAPCEDILYYPGGESVSYTIVAGVDLENENAEVDKQVVLGSTGEVYASRENLYIAEPTYNWGWYKSSEDETIVHKFDLENDINYQGKTTVPGTILNQFSMDEHEGYFRIATTLGNVWDNENKSQNNLYILNDDLEQVGEIEGMAPGERIYSVRFVGDRAYIVTFKKVDPLFVIDLASPSAPKILGKLKIPGYSDYLHPYDENHIIGFGKDTVTDDEDVEERGADFAWYQGMKIAMFDVTDVANPVELHKEIIGDRGTDSELLYNHKALLFEKDRGLLAFPVQVAEIPENLKENPDTPADMYGDYVFQGAYVYDVSVEDGFELRGAITQYEDDEVGAKSGTYWYGNKDVKRILRIGETLYTVSKEVVQANDLDDLDEVGKLELEGVEEGDWYWIY